MRYLPLSAQDREDMLSASGAENIRALYEDVPDSAYNDALIPSLPAHKTEMAVEKHMGRYANQNIDAAHAPFFLGAGVYNHHIPASVDYVIQRSEFLTAYTPYQPEIAQGTLQVIYEFQTMIAKLTGQDVANASLYDGATALAEAALMAMRVTRKNKVIIANDINPDYQETLSTYLKDDAIVDADTSDDIAAIIIQSPDFYGRPEKYQAWREKADALGALLVVVITEIISLGMLPAPDIADIVCGEGQSIGLPMNYGGPHLGFFACRNTYLRQMPGRLCGKTVDADGKDSYVLTLSTREQHIRRDKATSNICTNQGLCALAFTVHMALLGDLGFRQLAQLNHERAVMLADKLSAVKGITVENETFFNEFVITLPENAEKVVNTLAAQGIIAGLPLNDNRLLICATEKTEDADMDILIEALGTL
ncbi:MAG: aminomethyl-transferring glycine dehydrogenase subunit GcvPA [Alphaproteobacteria bacterium]|nr:aminomethyl-transferring glycine dehydrogenase subunit GcvPA [Alphaproteobacteria bacterium]